MKLYHASKIEVRRPDIHHSRKYLDFGIGYYLTPLESQAVKYGRRFLNEGETAILNTYELDEDLSAYSHKVFDSYDECWLDFVASCRKGLPHPTYDIIEGGIADDNVFNTLDLYFSGIYTKEQTLSKLKYEKPNYQVCITRQEVLDKHLHFILSQKIH